ncbi:hypothetical protein COLO4_31318 [Corchorus olitorius]|uniref:Peptidase C1A, papain n=1 Tax=Corchorus olitorius TaxID=93759 RepID=A0A1R3H4R0_9ROSI|nr:hypothetical protein COLO4_31318 [Corchorus olitorius]
MALASVMCRPLDEAVLAEKFTQWMAQHGRTYAMKEEEDSRFEIFKNNMEYIENFNKMGNQTYKLGLNEFADLANEEFLASYAGYKMFPSVSSKTKRFKYENLTKVPASIDWRQKGAVTPIKSQGACAVEGLMKIKTGQLLSLSEQQLVDCVYPDENQGCLGGWMDDAFKYIVKNKGLAMETKYPYRKKEGTCKTRKAAMRDVEIKGYEDVPHNSEKALLKAVSQQPVSVTIDSTGVAFQFYSEGVFTGPCHTKFSHAVTIVGYGKSKDGTKFWLAKNSWGKKWGENGYMRIKRDVHSKKGLCGIAQKASYPVA